MLRSATVSAPTNTSGFVTTLYYLVAGLGWVLPAMAFGRWMSKGKKAKAKV